MASLEEAEDARLAEEDRLGSLGAHAIEIQPLADRSGYELIVHFARRPAIELPRAVGVSRGGRRTHVPLRMVIRPD
jgi:hypothetical protein